MPVRNRRIDREKKTVAAMISLYCRNVHGKREICAECASLRDYALERLDRCPFQEGKTTCAKCRVHCYKPEMRQSVRTVMRYSGPRMIYRHPLLAVMHLVDSRRGSPVKPRRRPDELAS
jgi:hypothetical protein